MASIQFKYNSKASYRAGGFYKLKNIDLTSQKIIVISNGQNFMVDFPNVFESYVLPHTTSTEIIKKWKTNWMQFWQNQLNFAIWCATTGCGVDFNNHLNSQSKMMGSKFKFHVYYQIRRIFKEMSIPLLQDSSWNVFENA